MKSLQSFIRNILTLVSHQYRHRNIPGPRAATVEGFSLSPLSAALSNGWTKVILNLEYLVLSRVPRTEGRVAVVKAGNEKWQRLSMIASKLERLEQRDKARNRGKCECGARLGEK